MNDLDVLDPFETLLADALAADAERAPAMPDRWSGPTIATVTDVPRRSSRRPATVVLGVAAAAVLIVGLVLVARPSDDEPAPADTTAPGPNGWTPEGEEFPLTDLGPATEVPDGPVVADLTRRIGVPGRDPLIVTTSLAYDGHDTAYLNRCAWESPNGGGACTPEWTGEDLLVSGWATGDGTWLIVRGIPEEAAYVALEGSEQRWQRPISGVAVFAADLAVDTVLVMYDRDGQVISRFDRDAQVAAQTRAAEVVQPMTADISQGYFNELQRIVRDELRDCLEARGGTISGDVATFPDGVDQVAIWESCVVQARTAVEALLAELDPRYFDEQAGERPENPASPWGYEPPTD